MLRGPAPIARGSRFEIPEPRVQAGPRLVHDGSVRTGLAQLLHGLPVRPVPFHVRRVGKVPITPGRLGLAAANQKTVGICLIDASSDKELKSLEKIEVVFCI